MISIERNLNLICNHPFSKKLYFDSTFGKFEFENQRGKKIRIKGLTKSLKECFWHDYHFTHTKFGVKTGISTPKEGMMRGSIVHKELEDYCNIGKLKNINAFIKKYPTIHQFTFDIIKLLETNNINALASEFSIYDEHEFATNIDMLGVKNQELCIIEVKTGMDNYLTKSEGKMHGPKFLQNLNNSPLHQAYLQLLIMQQMIEVNYNVKIKQLYVIVANTKGANLYEMPNVLYNTRNDIYSYFIQYIEKKKADKILKRKRKNKKK